MTLIFRHLLSASFFALVLASCGEKKKPVSTKASSLPAATSRGNLHFSPSSACLKCHAEAHQAWQKSHHALAHRDTGNDVDALAFSAGKIALGDARWTFSGGGREPVIRWSDAADRAASPIEAKPPMAIGYEPLVQYLVATEKGRYQIPDMAWDPAKTEWFSIYGDQNRRPVEWGHWTGRGMNWNSQCAYCHFTALNKNYDPAADRYDTKWVEQGVGCAQCHGPDRPNHQAGECLVDPKQKFTPRQWTHSCATCHARREEFDEEFVIGDSFFDHYSLALPSQPGLWHPDGQQIEEIYNFNSLLLSRMGHKGISCNDCHDPHAAEPKGGEIAIQSNALCLTCHAGGQNQAIVINPATHMFHQPGTPGGRCVDCHMPTTTYMGRDPRHDHRFPIPDPLLTKELGVPNACNTCHQDRGLDWQIGHVEKWYGDKMDAPTHGRARTRAIAAAQGGTGSLEALLPAYDAETIAAWRATLLRLMESRATDKTVAARAEKAAADPDPVVRSAAAYLLSRNGEKQAVVDKLMTDPVKSVRFEAAWGAFDRLPPGHPMIAEIETIARHQSDQPAGAMRMARIASRRGDAKEAEKWFRRAIEWDRGASVPRRDFAVFLGSLGRIPESIQWLDEAAKLDPANAEIPYLSALARAELGDTAGVISRLEEAIRLEPNFARAHYNLGLALSARGQAAEAIAALRRAESLSPLDPNPPYARATIHYRLGDRAAALEATEEALSREPNYPEALQLKAELER